MNSYIFVVCSIWCKTLFIVVVVINFVALKVVRLPFFKSCHHFPTAVEVRFILLQNVGLNWDFRGFKNPHKRAINFSKLNYNVQGIYFRVRSFIASSHPQWLLRSEKKNEFNFSKLKFKVLKSVNLDRAIVSTTALYPAENPKESRRYLPYVVDPYTESATGPFPSTYFRIKVRGKGFMPEIN